MIMKPYFESFGTLVQSPMITETDFQASPTEGSWALPAAADISAATNSRTPSPQKGNGSRPIASESRHFNRELTGRGAGRLRLSSEIASTKLASFPAASTAERAKSAKLAPSPELTTW